MAELEPVGEDEFVYRRIHICYFNGSLPIAIQRGAFHPTDSDTTGISVYRARFVEAVDLIPADKRDLYYVARLSVRALRDLGLSAKAKPDPDGPPGHAVIPELARPSYVAEKSRWAKVLVQLAALASADIVLRPVE
jgi:hypothetical protein